MSVSWSTRQPRGWAGALSRLLPAICILFPAASLVALPAPLALPRGTLDVRAERLAGSPTNATWKSTVAPVYVNIPKMSASFVAAEDDTNLAITFSAEAQTSVANKRLFVRALIDGVVAAPADVVFTEGGFGGARSFTFVGVVDKGVHTVEMQWLVDAGANGSLRIASLLLRHGVAQAAGGTLTHTAPPSGTEQRTTETTWQPVPSTSVTFWAPAGAEPIVNFSAETHVAGGGKRLFVRAKVDGVTLSPGDVVFAQRAVRQVHRMSFTGQALAEGWHTATIEWLVDAGGVATLGDRSLVVTAFPQTNALRHDLVVAPGGAPVSTASSTWASVPNLSALVPVPKNGEFAVGFSGEASANADAILEMRLLVNGVASNETAVIAQLGQVWETQSFTFDRKHVFTTQGGLVGVELQWRALGGTVWLGDRALELVAEPGLVPDLAEAPEIGLGTGSFPAGQPVEAAIGTRKLLTIIHGITRAVPNNVIPSVAQVTSAVFGATGTADYYDKVSGGRFGLQNVGVLSYPALKSESHYWNHAGGNFDCGQAMADGFKGGHAERWAESIALADPDVDFASFDRDGDGVVRGSELAILIVVPQASAWGTTRPLDTHCDGSPVMADGVAIEQISEWFTSAPTANSEIATHELAHQMFNLGDMYDNGNEFDTEVGRLSLMGDNAGTTSHLDAPTKFALGWLTPVYAPSDGAYELPDVRTGGTALVLPRSDQGDGREFFVLENRRAVNGDGLYDSGVGANGGILWHVVESSTVNATPPACTTPLEWAPISGNGRRGLRVMRPGVNKASSLLSSWNMGDYDLVDNGLACPGVVPVRNALLWADGSASGYGLLGWSAGGALIDFTVDLP
jgi:M6 family metalloprotease-like protein